ncbi:hypothetical protein DY926_16465 [Komagataeibacter melaceti]|uniref:Uncharacterized protein n=1 Tax=Komagataeibacter melaceti TaxID=2766577 RepID=A0A371YW73_9PROT|nr:hypothetical protein [Komagataeibacter melaceti]RFD18474.1 hypothetical protein DY926_16465 [Komagataeibacter melaceti]
MPDTHATARRILRALLPPPQTPKHREDRLKALAGAFQTLALGAVGVGFLTPMITDYTALNRSHVLVACLLSLIFEGISLTLLAYIPYDSGNDAVSSKGDNNG